MRFGTFDAPRIGSRLFEELSAREATTVAKQAAAEMPAALARIAGDVGEPDPRRPLDSVRAGWAWLLGRLQVRHGGGDAPSWADAEMSDLPYWCWFRDLSGIFMPMGPEVSRDVDAYGAFIAALLAGAHPGATVTRSSAGQSAVDFRKPVLRLPDGSEWWLPGRFVVAAKRAIDPGDRFHADVRSSDGVTDVIRAWMLRQPAEAAIADETGPTPPSVSAVGGRAGEFVIEFDDVTAHEGDRRVDRFVERLAAHSELDVVVREDRELISASAPTRSLDDIARIVRDTWTSLADEP